MIYKETIEPRISDYNQRGTLSLESILNIAENAGSHHSNLVNKSVIEGSLNGIAWILAEWNVEIKHVPCAEERLHISTWVRVPQSSSSTYRDVIFRNENDDICILACAKFVLFDLHSHRPMRISPELFDSYQPEDTIGINIPTSRLTAPIAYETETPIALRRSDMDFNAHLHNARYISLALEALPQSLYESVKISAFRIVYRLPITPNQMITVRCHVNNCSANMSLHNQDGETCTLIEIRFTTK